jgi:hypothetical protein
MTNEVSINSFKLSTEMAESASCLFSIASGGTFNHAMTPKADHELLPTAVAGTMLGLLGSKRWRGTDLPLGIITTRSQIRVLLQMNYVTDGIDASVLE